MTTIYNKSIIVESCFYNSRLLRCRHISKVMNKKKKTFSWAIVIIFILGLWFSFGRVGVGSFDLFGIKSGNSDPLTGIIPEVGKDDWVAIDRKGGINYEINVESKELRIYKRPIDGVAEFAGLPKEKIDKEIIVEMSRVILSANAKQALVVFTTYDHTSEPSGFDGSYPFIKNDDFVCDVAEKKCAPTDLLKYANESVSEISEYYRIDQQPWYVWDSEKNLLYGHLNVLGSDGSPVYIFDLTSKILRYTLGYNSRNKNEKSAVVPNGAFSPSLSKFVMIDNSDFSKSRTWHLMLYDSADLSMPIKKYIISTRNKDGRFENISSVAWSSDEKTLVLLTGREIFTLNLDNGKNVLIYSNPNSIDSNGVVFSPSNRYIIFLGYEEVWADEDGVNYILKAIDLQNGNKVIELLHEKSLSLGVGFF